MRRAALFIDCQNMWPFNYAAMHTAVRDYDVLIKRVYLTNKDIEYHREKTRDIVGALQNNGFEPILTGYFDNVDPYMIADVVEVIYSRDDIETIILSTRDSDFVPTVNKAKLRGKDTILITNVGQERVSAALKSSVHKHIEIPSMIEHERGNSTVFKFGEGVL